MKFRYKEVEIRMQSGHSSLRKIRPEWEIPVLQAIHDEVTEIGDVVVDRAPPSASAEMERLKANYGASREEGGFTGLAYVETVYGQHAIGVQALKRAMQASVLPASTPVTILASSPEMRQDLLRALTDTPTEISDLIGEPEETEDEIAA